MSTELDLRFRHEVPKRFRTSLDTRLQWLWRQRFGTIQMIWKDSKDVLDHTACTLILQAVMGRDLQSIELLLSRLEGGAVHDDKVAEAATRSLSV